MYLLEADSTVSFSITSMNRTAEQDMAPGSPALKHTLLYFKINGTIIYKMNICCIEEDVILVTETIKVFGTI